MGIGRKTEMEIVAKWKFSKNYLELYWLDWINYRSKQRKNVNRYSLASIFLGIGISAAFMIKGFSHSLLGLLLIVSGIVSFVWHYWDKYNWFRFLIQESDFDSENIITFSEENLKIQGKHSNGEINWSGIKDLVLAKYGLFLVLSKGISIYIPKGALSEDMLQVQELYKKAKLQSETD